MNIAYLILAHEDPAHLTRLVNALYTPNSYFFIHVDRKVAQPPFTDPLSSLPNVVFLRRRVRVFWAGFSMVKATLLLMQEAVAHPIAFKYYVMLSGVDYPIKSNAYIRDFLSNAHEEFISHHVIPDTEGQPYDRGGLDRIAYYYFQDSTLTNTRHNDDGSLRSWISRAFHYALRQIPIKRTYPMGLTPYGGWRPMALTHGCTEYVLNFVAQHPAFLRFHWFTHAPDEIVIQTIVLNSCFQYNVVDDGLQYIDYSLAPHYILSEQHYQDICTSPALFARKLRSADSDRLLSLIDQLLR